MKHTFLIRIAVYNVISRRLRALLTVGGIGISVALMVVLMGFGKGLESLVTEQVTHNQAQNVISITSKSQQLRLDEPAISDLKSISGVADLEEIVGLSSQVRFNNVALNLPAYAVSANHFDLSPADTRHGRLLESKDSNANVMVITVSALEAFGITDYGSVVDRPVDVTLSILKDHAPNQEEDIEVIETQKYQIVGVTSGSGNPVAYIPLEPLRKYGVTVATQAKVSVTYPEKTDSVRESIEQMGYQTASIKDSIDQVERVFGLINSILIYFGIITIIVAGFSTLNTITIELVEQTKQISFLRIMGMSRSKVGIIFILQSILLATTGALLGIGFGLLLGFSANGIVSSIAGDLVVTGDVYIFQVPTLFITGILLCAFGIGWCIGVVPARRAVKINPLLGAEQ